MIKAQNITRTYTTGAIESKILKGITVTINTGDFVAIMGKSGAGKSTLLYQLSILDEPTTGSLEIEGIDVIALSEKERTTFRLNTLGFVFQDYALVPDLTARENVMIPLLMRDMSWSTAKVLADSALDSVGLAKKYENLPSQLSGGEQQRASIARAIASKPKILFADEPTANLDTFSGTQVIELLGRLHKEGQTIVMVTHEPEYTHYCNRVIEMEDGLIVNDRIK